MSAAHSDTAWLAVLAADVAALPPGALWVGFSGGLDSAVLLHALAHIPAARERGLAALHVDHGSCGDSAHWAEHCRAFAAGLNIETRIVKANVRNVAELGLEGAWRRARHAAFEETLPEPAVLALAQHREDQVETLLLRLLHGAGHEGLAAMRRLRPLRSGETRRWLWRPLLDLPRQALRDYATAQRLTFIEDPANADPRHARVRLRASVMPALRDAFPEADARIAAAAGRMRGEADALRAVALGFLATHRHPHDASLPANELAALADALRREVVARWLDDLKLPRPPAAIWPRLVPELIEAAADAQANLHWRGAQLRRHRGRIFAFAPFDDVPPFVLGWNGLAPLSLPHGLGTLALDPAPTEPQRWQVRSREGGERIRIAGVNRSLKHLMQEAALPPWERGRLPLLFDADGQLLAAGARWRADRFAARLATRNARLVHSE